MLRGKDVHVLGQMKQMGLSVSAISELTGYDRKTVRKYLLEPEGVPSYVARAPAPSRLDRHKPYLQDRLADGVRNAQVLLREIRALGYDGSYTILKDWLHPQRRLRTRRRFAGFKRHQASKRKSIVKSLPGIIWKAP